MELVYEMYALSVLRRVPRAGSLTRALSAATSPRRQTTDFMGADLRVNSPSTKLLIDTSILNVRFIALCLVMSYHAILTACADSHTERRRDYTPDGGEFHCINSNSSNCIKQYHQAVSQDPDCGLAWALLGFEYFRYSLRFLPMPAHQNNRCL